MLSAPCHARCGMATGPMHSIAQRAPFLAHNHLSRRVPHDLHKSSQKHKMQHKTCRWITAATKMEALIFDCDGKSLLKHDACVILESEDLHRVSYNAAFEHFDVRPKGKANDVANWSVEFYDVLQNKIGGGKPKMRWYFGDFGWPSSKILPEIPETDDEKTTLIDVLQEWKTTYYQDLIASGKVKPRPGVIELFDEARQAGLKLGVCSAATKSSAIAVLENLLGPQRFRALDVFMAGDDVPEKKPDPSIYKIAAKRIQVDPKAILVIEDSMIGLAAAKGAGMRCIITYTDSTKDEAFEGAEVVLSQLGLPDTPQLQELIKGV